MHIQRSRILGLIVSSNVSAAGDAFVSYSQRQGPSTSSLTDNKVSYYAVMDEEAWVNMSKSMKSSRAYMQ
jgi:hypothetical protein